VFLFVVLLGVLLTGERFFFFRLVGKDAYGAGEKISFPAMMREN